MKAATIVKAAGLLGRFLLNLVPWLVIAWCIADWTVEERMHRLSLFDFLLTALGVVVAIIGIAIGLDWLRVRRNTWIVHEDHVEVLRAGVSLCRIPFSEILRLNRLPFGVSLVTTNGRRYRWSYLSEEQLQSVDALCAALG